MDQLDQAQQNLEEAFKDEPPKSSLEIPQWMIEKVGLLTINNWYMEELLKNAGNQNERR